MYCGSQSLIIHNLDEYTMLAAFCNVQDMAQALDQNAHRRIVKCVPNGRWRKGYAKSDVFGAVSEASACQPKGVLGHACMTLA